MKAMFVLFLLPLQLFSQDLSGIWVGTIATSQVQMPFELAINQDMTGYSMISFTYKGAEKIAVKKITLIRKDSTFTISDDKLVYDNIETRHRNIKSFCELSIKMVDTIMVLSGPFHTRTRDLRAGDEDLATGTITLQKQRYQAQTRLIGKLDSLKLSNTLTFSNPQATIRETPVVAAAEKPAPAAAGNPVKETAAATAQQPAMAAVQPAAGNPVKDTAAATARQPAMAAVQPAAGNAAKDLTATKAQQPAAAIVPAVVPAEVPAAAPTPVKNLTAAKMDQPVTAAVLPPTPKITPVAAEPAIPKITPAAAEISVRKTEVIRTIDFKADSLTLVLYDNGIVDGDTVTVVLNGEVIIPKQRLSDTAYQKVIRIPPGLGDSLQLVIYAENLGSIPPNSGLLIIQDGSDRNDIGFEGDLKRSSAVILRRKK